MNNQIDAVITPESSEKVRKAIDSVKTELPFLLTLSEEERSKLQQVDDGRLSFVSQSFVLATNNDFLDPGTDLLANAKKDLDLYNELNDMEVHVRQLLALIHDTKQLAGSEAFIVARFVYIKAQSALKMNRSGAKEIVDELSKLFKHNKKDPPNQNPA